MAALAAAEPAPLRTTVVGIFRMAGPPVAATWRMPMNSRLFDGLACTSTDARRDVLRGMLMITARPLVIAERAARHKEESSGRLPGRQTVRQRWPLPEWEMRPQRCTMNCFGTPGGVDPQPRGPVDFQCQSVNRSEGIEACVKSAQRKS
jgi:hypothetical protein